MFDSVLSGCGLDHIGKAVVGGIVIFLELPDTDAGLKEGADYIAQTVVPSQGGIFCGGAGIGIASFYLFFDGTSVKIAVGYVTEVFVEHP